MASGDERAPDYEILGVSLFGPPPVGVVHLPWAPRLEVLYGVNGSGKTTILESFAAAVAGRWTRSRSYGPVRFSDVGSGDAHFLHVRLTDEAVPIDWSADSFTKRLTQGVEEWARAQVFSADGAARSRPGAEFTFAEWEEVLGADHYAVTIEAALRFLWGDNPELRKYINYVAGQGMFSLMANGDKWRRWAIWVSAPPSNLPRNLLELITDAGEAFTKELEQHKTKPSKQSAQHLRWGASSRFLWGPDTRLTLRDAGRFVASDPPAWAPIPLASIGGLKAITDLAPGLFRVDQNTDPDALAEAELFNRFDVDNVYIGLIALNEGSDHTPLPKQPEWVAVGEFLAELSHRASETLSELIPDAPVLTAEPADVLYWHRHGPLVEWFALDTPTGRRVPLKDLSKAQRRWAIVAIEWTIWLMRGRSFYAAVVVDEPELALHPTAIEHLRRDLAATPAGLGGPVVVATHSPRFLNIPTAHLLHVKRRPKTGLAQVTEMQEELAPGLLSAGEALGLEPADLLQLVRLYLIVEGKRDEAILDEAFREDFARAGVVIVPMHGTRKLHSIVDSPFIFDYTNAKVVVAVDRMRRDIFVPTWDKARTTAKNGQRELASKLLGEIAHRKDISSEEEIVLQFCRNAVDRCLEDRLEIFGFEQPDLVYYLPVEKVVPGAESWTQVQREYKRDRKSNEDLKTWAWRKKRASTSPRRLRTIVRNLDTLHPELTTLLDTCMRLAQPPDPTDETD